MLEENGTKVEGSYDKLPVAECSICLENITNMKGQLICVSFF